MKRDILRRVKAKFDSADLDGTGQLHPQEFIKAFLGILQTEDGGDAEALAKLFMRIDANSDGTIDWDEFSTYMLLESQGSARVREFESTVTMQQAEPSPVSDLLAHKDAMTHITAMRLANGVDRYATCGRDGTVRLWNAKDLKHIKTLHLPRPRAPASSRSDGTDRIGSARGRQVAQHGGLWATCSAFMPLTQKLAVGSFSRSIRIYDLASYELAGQIPEIDYVPLCLDVWVPSRAKDSELMVVGDGGGWVRLFEVRSSTGSSGTDSEALASASAAGPGGGAGGSGVERLTERPRWRYHHHNDWVMAVKYVSDMNCVLAASLDKTVSITDAEERVPLKKLEGHHNKGVNAVDWSSLYKFVVTGSLDRKVILWNPFSQKPLAVLAGHNAAVTGVVVNDRDNQIISLSTDHIIKIWDIRNHKCVQTLSDRELLSMPQHATDDAVTPVLYDPERRQLVTGYLKPKVWKMTTAGAGATQAHNAAVTRVVYNANFSEAISADHAGTISVWHVPTGKLRYRFLQCHGNNRITALAFDAARRRLITGAEDGDCKIWNFSSGACLSHLQSKTRAEVTALVPLRGPLTRYVLAAGWDRRITFYEDNAAKAVGPSRALAGHKADILAMVALEGSSTVVTASDDGELWVWNMDSCAPKRRMIAPGTAARPANERAVEALAFLAAGGGGGTSTSASSSGRLRGVLVAVGADRWLRLWDVLDGTLLAERFTGHRQGETVQALALDGNNTRIATGDSGGMIKVWDMSRYTGGVLTPQAAASTIRELAVWRGHKGHVTSLDWVDVAHSGGGGALGALGVVPVSSNSGSRELFLVSSSADCTVAVWTEGGARIGTFGQNTWVLQERDSWIMEASRVIPRSDPAAPASSNGTAASPVPPLPVATSLIGDIGNFAAAGGPAAGSGPGRPMTAAAALAASAAGRLSPVAPLRPLSSVTDSGGSGPRSRPDSAPAEIALVCGTSYALRAEQRLSLRRRAAPSRGTPGGATEGGGANGGIGGGATPAAPDAGGAGGGGGGSARGGVASARGSAGGATTRPSSRMLLEDAKLAERLTGLRLAMTPTLEGPGDEADADEDGGEGEGGEEDEEDVDLSSSVSSSDDHDSDVEVPTALWLHEFDAARKRRLVLAKEAYSSGGASSTRAYGAGGRAGVAHLLKVSELSMLQERPVTSYMSSRRGVATAAGVLSKASGSPPRPSTAALSTSRKG
ncbi:hypothetical protein GPECTOR_1g56 [Gonium pectorale]|uniref:EF-hand domain-containing protein n=1 Tax=Gonium pectorale TaxID=33097 RepID=A0A150H3I0_GONPE|nr:hypothetical protein GPECTOR_1g56 [Gonium pectorale]|eukprot:KXZ56621.1 hypothetical protein GPECTOR_1g56 [Gonium pectorale]